MKKEWGFSMGSKRVTSIITDETYYKVGVNCKDIEAIDGLFSISFKDKAEKIGVSATNVWIVQWEDDKKDKLSKATNFGARKEPYHWEEGMGYPWTKNN